MFSASEHARDAILACIAAATMSANDQDLSPFRCPLSPFLGPFDPAASDIVFQQERQIVRPALGLHGFLPEFG
jgi:hypothetical protein